ncbi:DNA methyltransferase [Aneurinibacillus tyrosinisolvens]|uniref:DNA methyltransferase n=1 Tax=Aneurinibacillus tyrosinisolvens TaxID=1443435 RepID=UPI00069C67C0|nr:DNA methyltransferase [Aneurinibacillus tyrosinisolvens]
MNEGYAKLKSILSEMFQLDQSDLDFGIYRIMNYKRKEIEKFLNEDLLPQVTKELEKYISVEQKNVEKELKELVKRLEDDGVPLESSNKYMTLKAKLDNGLSVSSAENEVYSHLANFFRRYYDKGDFMSLRRYKKDVYALPYEGEEVKLHWANADQYYIKTAEYFKDYSFKTSDGYKVHFKIVDADTEKDNNKVHSDKEKRFMIHKEKLFRYDGELTIYFDYVVSTEKQKDLIDEAIEIISRIINSHTSLNKYETLLSLQPSEKNLKRTLIEKYLYDYTSRNTFDYFIHKDLGGFLRRELDFYIKNEVMFLDDLDTENEVKIEQYLTKIKVIKKIGNKIIAFLEQIENFQKKLWLKKKFVVETNFCITLDKISEEFYPEIAKEDRQRKEWVKLFSINEIKGDLTTIGYSEPLTVDFLKQNKNLILDTALFNDDFKEKLLGSIDNIDKNVNGVLIKGENFQALNLLTEKYKESIQCAYIDPPYNTLKDEFLYKDNFTHSSWLSMVNDRIDLLKKLLTKTGVNMSSIGNHELARLMLLMNSKYGENNLLNVFIWNTDGNIDNQSKFKQDHEYIVAYSRNGKELPPPKVIDPNVPKDSKLYKKSYRKHYCKERTEKS